MNLRKQKHHQDAGIWELPCVEEIEKICGWKEEEHAGND